MAGDDERDASPGGDPDRAAILARRRRFVALALTGLASSGCKPAAEPCLSIAAPEDGGESAEPRGADGPIVEDPGAPLEATTGEDETQVEAEGEAEGETFAEPTPCLNVAAPPKPAPKPCLKKRAPKPHPCLLMID